MPFESIEKSAFWVVELRSEREKVKVAPGSGSVAVKLNKAVPKDKFSFITSEFGGMTSLGGKLLIA